jgi:hypothetical protein
MRVKSKIRKRIVAEITKSWMAGHGGDQNPLLAQQFEKVIAAHARRGFDPESWRMNSVLVFNGVMTETIIAVFVEADDKEKQ